MHTFVVSVWYSRDGVTWNSCTPTVRAYSESEAIEIGESRAPSGYAYVEVRSCKRIG